MLGPVNPFAASDGRTFDEDVPIAKGEPEAPLSREGVCAKFDSLAQETLGRRGVQQVLQAVQALHGVDDMAQFTKILRPQS